MQPFVRRSVSLGTTPLNFPLTLAPMVGLSHAGLRRVVRSYTPAEALTFWPTEMLNSRRLPSEDLAAVAETLRWPDETGLAPQILGNEERFIAPSLEKLEAWGAQAIDINMGCPVKKALQHNYGVSLMGDPRYAAEVVRMTVKNTKLPVSVKLRSGYSPDVRVLIDFMKGLQDAGASWLTLHPRLAQQMRRGSADWGQLPTVREALQIPMIGNGDVQVLNDALQLLEVYRCDMVMVGRVMTARPWLFWQMGERLGMSPPLGRSGPAPRTPEEEGAEYKLVLQSMLALSYELFGPANGFGDLWLRKFRFFVKTGAVWLEFGHQLWADLQKGSTPETIHEAIEKFFSVPQRMLQRTELRQ
jgi:tRNA-dihydrouridine synthase B